MPLKENYSAGEFLGVNFLSPDLCFSDSITALKPDAVRDGANFRGFIIRALVLSDLKFQQVQENARSRQIQHDLLAIPGVLQLVDILAVFTGNRKVKIAGDRS